MSISDIMIHIDQSLNTEARLAMEERMRQIEGVVAPRFNSGKEHLLLVAFNSDKASAAALLGAVRASGYSAQLVGV